MSEQIKAPFLGYRLINSLSIDEIQPFINKKALYRISWGALNAKGEKWQQIQLEFDKRLDSMLVELRVDPWMQIQAAYGHWLATADDDHIVIYDPINSETMIAKFQVPRQEKDKGLSLADYFPKHGVGSKTILSLQIVTAGNAASDHIQDLFDSGKTLDGYFAHGLAAQCAEATAAYVHDRIRQELGLGTTQGRRYSWGYPALPDLEQHKTLFQLIPVEKEFGMKLTSAYQMIPEQSTAALVIHNKNARYFRMNPEVSA